MRFRPFITPEERIDAVRRRPPRPTPLRRLRAGGRAAPAGSAPFPGFPALPLDSYRPRTAAGLLAIFLHAAGLALAVYVAARAPDDLPPEPIPVQLLREAPRPSDPAPAQRIRAERRDLALGSTARVVAAQLPSPTVVAAAAPAIAAERLEIGALRAASTPRQIERSQLEMEVETVRPVPIAAQPPPPRFEVEDAAAPALRGPLSAPAPVGPSTAPRASPTPAASAATAPGSAAQAGAARDRGVLSNRDVFGSADGVPVAQVNTRAGQGRWRGAGGNGTGNGARAAVDCERRPAVRAYQRLIRARLLERWHASAPSQRRTEAVLSFVLDPAGSLRASSLISAESPELGRSALAALRAAAPFPPMPDAARCLAGDRWTGTFTLSPHDGSDL